MKRSGLLLVLVAFAVACTLAVGASAAGPGPFNQDPGGGGGGGGSCDFCTQPQCGCSQPPAGFYLVYSCACGGSDCTRSCSYQQL